MYTSILYWPLDPDKSFIFLNVFFSWVIVTIKCIGLNFDYLSPDDNVRGKNSTLQNQLIDTYFFSPLALKPANTSVWHNRFTEIEKFQHISNHVRLNEFTFFFERKEKFVMEIGQTKCNHSQFSTLHRISMNVVIILLFDEHIFHIHFAYTYKFVKLM